MNDYKYIVSVIVPIYNSEAVLRACIDSLIQQKQFEDIEVILVDDGSEDESVSICNEYVNEYDNIRLIEQQNCGVSQARNAGMINAQGKYIMFLDSDDFWGKSTIYEVYSYFETVYDQVDVVTYPEEKRLNNEVQTSHFRYNYLTKTGIYDLNEDIYITQSRINVAIKNLDEKNLFDTNLKSAEDQEFLGRLLAPKMKIGFVKKGKYIYNQYAESVSAAEGYVFYFENVVDEYYGKMFGTYKNVPRYFQAMMLYDLNWKIRKDQIWPYHFDDVKFAEYKSKLIELLNRCDIDVILNHPALDYYHKLYLLRIRNEKVQVLAGRNGIRLYADNKLINETKEVDLVVCQVKTIDNRLKIVAHVKTPAFLFVEKPKVFALINETEEEMELFDSGASRYKSKIKTAQFWGFYFEKSVQDINKLGFEAEIDGLRYETKMYFMPQSNVYLEAGINTLFTANKCVKVNQKIFEISEVFNSNKIEMLNEQSRLNMKKAPELFETIKSVDIYRRKKIWLYYDCRGVDYDNGYYQFIHDFDMNDGILRFYIYNNDVLDEKLFSSKHERYVIKFGSAEHKKLYINADKIITAFAEKNNVCPFTPEKARYLNNWNSFEEVYLQHGILHASIPWKYTPEGLPVDKVVVSSEFEKKNFEEKYHFRKQDIIDTGMARFDHMDLNRKPGKVILLAPTWRNYLICPQVDNY